MVPKPVRAGRGPSGAAVPPPAPRSGVLPAGRSRRRSGRSRPGRLPAARAVPPGRRPAGRPARPGGRWPGRPGGRRATLRRAAWPAVRRGAPCGRSGHRCRRRGQGLFVDHDAEVRAAPCRVPAVPASRAAWQAAVRPSIRRCAAVRVSSVPRGGPNVCTAVLMISSDSPSPHARNGAGLVQGDAERQVTAWNRLRSRSSARPGRPGRSGPPPGDAAGPGPALESPTGPGERPHPAAPAHPQAPARRVSVLARGAV